MTSTQPLDSHDLTTSSLDARDRLAGPFDHRRHVIGVGVNDAVGIAHDSYVAVPENQIAQRWSAGLSGRQGCAETVLLHVAVARAVGARGVQCNLDKAGAIDSQ